MKKINQILILLTLSLTLTACAPKTNLTDGGMAEPSTTAVPHSVYETFTLYFPDEDGSHLTKETHELRIGTNTTQEKLILDALKMGPMKDDLESPLSDDAMISSIKTVSGLCTIEISENFLNADEGEIKTANLMLHAIVNSLCELDTVQQVKFNVNGETNATVYGEIDLSQPISPDTADL